MAAAVAAEPSAARFGGLAVALGATALALRVAHQAAQPGELRLDAAGNLWWRPTVDAQAEPLVAVGLSRWLAVFDGAGGRHSVWRDSLPPAHWRLLRAHLRWHVERDRTAPVAAAGAPDRLSNP